MTTVVSHADAMDETPDPEVPERAKRPRSYSAPYKAEILGLGCGPRPVRNQVRDDERGREEDQAEDEVPEEAVALSASDTGGPERYRDPDDSKQGPPDEVHDPIPPRLQGTLLPAAGRQLGTNHGGRGGHHGHLTPHSRL